MEERSRDTNGWKERRKMNILTAGVDYFIKGGWVMWPLLICSIAALAIGVERMLFFRKADSGRHFTKQFCQCVENNDWNQAKELADRTQGEIAKLATIVMERHDNYEYLENFISYRAERALDKFENHLPYLNIIVTLAPVLGLLGTVTGMMGAFNHITQRMTNPMGVTSGLAEALITTVFGLCISIVAVVFHGYFERRMKLITLNIEEMGNTLLEAVRKKETCSVCCHPERRRA